MITLRKSHDRGHANHGWLDSFHTFSFADYYDPAEMGFGPLRVINEDRVAPGKGFPTHPHRNMESLTYVLSGALEHRDSLGNGSVIRAGDVQRMSAGTGVTRSEFNVSASEPVHFLQIWITPARTGTAPGYAQRFFPAEEKRNRWRVIASPVGDGDALSIQQDVSIYATSLDADWTLAFEIPSGRRAYLHLARGRAMLNGHLLEAGDGAKIVGTPALTLVAKAASEALLFDLP